MMKLQVAAPSLALGLAIGFIAPSNAATPVAATAPLVVVAQAMVPPTGMTDAEKPMPMDERMLRRFPQPVRVGDLIGLPVLDDGNSTIGFVRQVVRTPQGNIKLIVSYSRWFGSAGSGARLRCRSKSSASWPATGVARYAGERIRGGADLAGK